MSSTNATIQCAYCLAANSVSPGAAKCCCESCGRIFEVAKAPRGVTARTTGTEPPIVNPPRFAFRPGNTIRISGWPWPDLSSRSEEGRYKFFSLAFKHQLLIAVPMFALMLALAIGYEVSTLGMMFVVPLAIASAFAMGLGQTWILDNAYREGKNRGLLWWTPFYLQFYILTRWAICWRPMLLIGAGGAFYVSLIGYLMFAGTGTSMATNRDRSKAKPVDSNSRNASSNIKSSPISSASNNISKTSSDSPSRDTIWSYDSLVVPSVDSSQNQPAAASVQPIISPVFDADDGFREWSNLTGSHRVLAKFVAIDEEFVQLETKDSRKIRVEISKLSREDRRFLEPLLQNNPFEVVGGK